METVEVWVQRVVRRHPSEEDVDQAVAAGPAGVCSLIRRTASEVIRNHRLVAVRGELGAETRRCARSVFGLGSRSVRVRAPPGQSSRAPSMTVVGPSPEWFLRTALRAPLGARIRRVFRSVEASRWGGAWTSVMCGRMPVKVSDRRANDGPTHPTFVRQPRMPDAPSSVPRQFTLVPYPRTANSGRSFVDPAVRQARLELEIRFRGHPTINFSRGGGRRCRGKLRIRRKFATR